MPTPATAAASRRHDLDALRAFAMLLGIGLHAALSFVAVPWIVRDVHTSNWFGLFVLAVHGFRMPLFFLISGYFTAMLWRRRGLEALLRQRFQRIFLPFVLGCVTVIPAMNWIARRAIESAQVPRNTRSATSAPAAQRPQSTLITALRSGDATAVEQALEHADPNESDGEFGVTPLAWAVFHRNPQSTQLLLARGADVNGRNRDGSTPLHCAAFLGNDSSVGLLIERGADATARNHRGETPLDATRVDWGTTSILATALQVHVPDEPTLAADRERCREALLAVSPSSEDSDLPGQASQEEAAAMTWRAAYGQLITSDRFRVSWLRGPDGGPLHLFLTPVVHHLWFLWFLCWLVPAFAIVVTVVPSKAWSLTSSRWVVSPLRYLWLVPLTLIPQWFMGVLHPWFGPDTSAGVLPQPHLLLYYGIFFGFGSLYYACDEPQGRLGRWWWLTIPFAMLAVLPLGLYTMGRAPVAALAQVLFTWLMVFGLIGLFRRLLTREYRTIRYLSDSSYWLYLAHLPLVIAAQAYVRSWALPAPLKFLLICAVVTGFLLIMYQTLVRYTWLGKLLNGPRTRPSQATAQIQLEVS